ncbi:helix-turn-helix domain-containing protein [Natrarchaeobaculum sulfurireducens]
MKGQLRDKFTEDNDGQRNLRAEIAVSTGHCPCPLEEISNSSVISHKILGDCCHILAEGGRDEPCPEQVQTDVSPECLCAVFMDYNCVPILEGTRDDGIVISTYLPNRDVLKDIVSDLREVADDVSLRRLSVPTDRETSDVRSVNLSVLTEHEQHTLTVAIESGYYGSPRQISFDELASKLEVSKSSLSQRLSSAESKLLLDLLER